MIPEPLPIKQRTFLSAEWRKLVLINYAIDPDILKKYLPNRTELDLWNGRCYISLVGFMFVDTRMLRVSIPYHKTFEEINLRFYVKYKDMHEMRRGVVFIKEIVPRPAITLVANMLYKEKYETLKTKHLWREDDQCLTVSYSWLKEKWHSISVVAAKEAVEIQADSEADFITDHFWGYTKINEKQTSEYEVLHPRWQMYPVLDYTVDVNFERVYGSEFAFLQHLEPASVYLAEGSQIEVRHGRKIKSGGL